MTLEFQRRSMTEAEAEALNAQMPSSWEDYLRFYGGPEGMRVCDGPLVVDSDLELEGRSLMVMGDLSCGAVLVNEGSSLIVTGTLRAKSIVADGNVFIFGDLYCNDIYGASFCNRLFCCKGRAEFRCLVEKGHSFEFNSPISAKLVASLSNVVTFPQGSQVEHDFTGGMSCEKERAFFSEEVIEDGTLKERLLIAKVLQNAPILRI